MTPDNALRQAHNTAHDYTMHAVSDLCDILNIDRKKEGWREQLAPFATVLAAMVTAVAMDFDTAVGNGAVDGYNAAAPWSGD
jgi:hypothetical protein